MTNQKSEKTDPNEVDPKKPNQAENMDKPKKDDKAPPSIGEVAGELYNSLNKGDKQHFNTLIDECVADPKAFYTYMILTAQRLEQQHVSLRNQFSMLELTFKGFAVEALQMKHAPGKK